MQDCSATSCWNSQIATVAQQVLVVMTEFGYENSDPGYFENAMTWADTSPELAICPGPGGIRAAAATPPTRCTPAVPTPWRPRARRIKRTWPNFPSDTNVGALSALCQSQKQKGTSSKFIADYLFTVWF